MTAEQSRMLNKRASRLLNGYSKGNPQWPDQVNQLLFEAVAGKHATDEAVSHFAIYESKNMHDYSGDPARFRDLSLDEKIAILMQLTIVK